MNNEKVCYVCEKVLSICADSNDVHCGLIRVRARNKKKLREKENRKERERKIERGFKERERERI